MCNISSHQTLENQIKSLRELKKKVSEVTTKINEYWDKDKNQIIELKEKANVLGSNWGEKLLEKSTVEEIATEGDKLIKNIDERRKIEEEKQKEYEKQIQVEIDKAQNFIKRTLSLSIKEANELLEKLRQFRDEYAASSTPAKYRAFLNKNKEDAFNKLIGSLRIKISIDGAIESIDRELKDLDQQEKKRYPLQSFQLKGEYGDFENKIRKMNSPEEINGYENGMIKSINILRPVYVSLNEIYNSVEKLSDSNGNQEETQKIRENALDFLLDLEKYKNALKPKNETM